MLVMAEDFQNPGNSSVECEQLARYVCLNLERKNVAPLIDPNLALDSRARGTLARDRAQVGAQLGALLDLR